MAKTTEQVQKDRDSEDSISKSITTRKETTTVLSKLVEPRGFGRGDFIIMQGYAQGAIVRDISIQNSIRNRTLISQPGEFFYIDGFPTDKETYIDYERLNRPAVRGKMLARLVVTDKDAIDEVGNVVPVSLINSMKGIASAIIRDGISSDSGNPLICVTAPTTLKDAVSRIRGVDITKHGNSYKDLPPNGKVIRDTKTGKLVFVGAHLEYDKDGGVYMTANNKGIAIKNNGDLDVQSSKIFMRESPDQPHGLVGMPTMRNPLVEFQPNTFFMPMGLGPLALERVPDLTVINWILKMVVAFDTIKEIGDLIDNKNKLRISKTFDERQTESQSNVGNKIK